MRLFLAVDIPEKTKESLGLVMQAIDMKSARKVSPGNLHITIAFFGEVKDEKAIIEAAKGIEVKPFRARLTRLGIFQSNGQPRTLWAGVAPREEFGELQKRVGQAFLGFGESRDTPHITLARFKHPTPQDKRTIQELSRNIDVEGEFEVTSLTLYKSTLTPQGPMYQEIMRL
jgi:RNA 2',3'-cyclic 3'-phosphodiesterase